MKSVQTKKGTALPLTNLKGKDYLMVAYRLQWLTEDVKNYNISTTFPLLNDEQTVCTALISLFDEQGKLVRSATATKRETKKDFNDHTEKAETAAIGRALAMLGFGTQHALSDLDEGQRIVDSPLQDVKPAAAKVEQKAVESPVAVKEEKKAVTSKPSFFNKGSAKDSGVEPAGDWT